MGLAPEVVSLKLTFFPEIEDLKPGTKFAGTFPDAIVKAAFLTVVTQQFPEPYAVTFTS